MSDLLLQRAETLKNSLHIALLIDFFLKRFNDENKKLVSLSPEALGVLVDYFWPGNVRELENTVERLVVMSDGRVISPSDLPVNLKLSSHKEVLHKKSLQAGIEDIEKSSIFDALEKTGWVQAKAARLIGLTQRQIGYKIKKYGMAENRQH
jgi:Nif-specific regulatory protein